MSQGVLKAQERALDEVEQLLQEITRDGVYYVEFDTKLTRAKGLLYLGWLWLHESGGGGAQLQGFQNPTFLGLLRELADEADAEDRRRAK